MERRDFLRNVSVSALAAVALSPLSLGADQNANSFLRRLQQARQRGVQRTARNTVKRIPIAVQVYSVRAAAAKDLAGTLAKIAEIGYSGVEFAGYYGKNAKDIRKMLDDNGLKCSGTHTGIGELRGDNFEKTLEFHQILGTKYIIVPGGIDGDLHDVEKNKKIAEEFSTLAEKAKPLGMRIGYHAHGGDAKLIEGIPAWERFFDAASPEVVMEMDIGNYMMGGGDPYKMIEKFKGRSKVVHLKEAGKDNPIVGSGDVDWKRSFNLLETIGGTEWYVVEDEAAPNDFTRIEQCLQALRKMGK